jgi:hypothetical protein
LVELGLLQVLSQQVGVHLRLQRSDAFQRINVFGRLGSKAKAQNTIILGLGNKSPASPSACSTCRCSSAPCSGPKLITTRSPAVQVATRVQAGRAGQHLQLGKLQHLPALATNARLEQFIAPSVLAAGVAAARH